MNIPRYKNNEKLVTKKCSFLGCTQTFIGTGKSKYCLEHRLKKYRKIIDKERNDRRINIVKEFNVNVVIKHTYSFPTELKMKCECCMEEYNITLYPNTFLYPRYCMNHRNEFKRLFYMKQHGIINEIPKVEMVLDPVSSELDMDLIKALDHDFNYR